MAFFVEPNKGLAPPENLHFRDKPPPSPPPWRALKQPPPSPANGSPAVRPVLPPPSTATANSGTQRPQRHQHALRLRTPRRRQGAWDSQPLSPPSRLRLLPAQVHWPWQPGLFFFFREFTVWSTRKERGKREVNLTLFHQFFAFWIAGCCICYVFQSSISGGITSCVKCENFLSFFHWESFFCVFPNSLVISKEWFFPSLFLYIFSSISEFVYLQVGIIGQ